MCMYIYIYVYICVCIYIYIYVLSIDIHKCIHTYIHNLVSQYYNRTQVLARDR